MNIKESMDRILQSESIFGKEFYEVFFARCPEAAPYFQGTDMKRQALVLTMTMTLIEQYYSGGFAAVEVYLQYLGMRHHDRHIPPKLFSAMRDALLESLKNFHDADWSDALSKEWSDAISMTSRQMLKGYTQRITI